MAVFVFGQKNRSTRSVAMDEFAGNQRPCVVFATRKFHYQDDVLLAMQTFDARRCLCFAAEIGGQDQEVSEIHESVLVEVAFALSSRLTEVLR